MRYGFEQSWAAPLDDVMAVYVDEVFWKEVTGFSRTTDPEVIEVSSGDGVALTRLRWRVTVALPREVERYIDPGAVSWIEETRWDFAARTASVACLPDQGASLIRASSAIEMTRDGPDTLRVVTGEVKVRIPLVGGRVERAIVEAIGEHLEEEADAVAAHLGLS